MTGLAVAVEPALYCGTYAKYNDGSIAGKWLKLRDYADAEAFLQGCQELHRDEADPELMFQDFEGIPAELYGESMSLVDLRKLFDWLDLPDDDQQLIAEYLEATGSRLDPLDVSDKLYCVLDYSHGLSDEAAMGWYVLDEALLEVPEQVEPYIDVEALGRDWLSDLYVSSNGYVFEA